MTSQAVEKRSGATGTVDKSGDRVRRMFGSIARRYDLLNHVLSLNIDRAWRRTAARELIDDRVSNVLDCCTGTGDLALAFDRRARGRCRVVGTDFCRPMLEIAARKVDRAGACDRICLLEADTLALPFPDNSFDVVAVAFGLRNVADTAKGLDEMRRVARPGGRVAVLEFSTPRVPLVDSLYQGFFRLVLPRVGQALAPNGDGAYEYLPRSVAQFPDGAAMLALMASRGLSAPTARSLTMGISTLYVGQKPPGGG